MIDLGGGAGVVNILISGLTAAGKTTHARLLANDLEYEYVSATRIIARIAGFGDADVTDRFWIEHGDDVWRMRQSGDLDAEVDRHIIQLCSDRDDLVVDAWAAPWLVDQPGAVRIWLSSSEPTRALKAAVSDGVTRSIEWYRDFIHTKDVETQKTFLALYNFDIFQLNESMFDVIIDNSKFIAEATLVAAKLGIGSFHPLFYRAVVKQMNFKR